MNADRDRALQTIRMVLAADCCCDERAFDRDALTVVPACNQPGRRRFPLRAKDLQIVTMGVGVVVSCHPDRITWIRSTLGGLGRDAIFSAPVLAELSSYVARDRQYLDGPGLRFACSRDRVRPAPEADGIQITLVDDGGIADLYRHPGFAEALAYGRSPQRPDTIAAVARRGDQIVGIAAASADSDALWQVGVHVLEPERRAGIGRAVVGRVTSAVLDRGKVPYYSTAVSNIASRSIAIDLGYWPAWTEVFVRDGVPNALVDARDVGSF